MRTPSQPWPSLGLSLSEVAAGLRRYRDLRIHQVQVQLRPNRIEGVRAFAPVIEALRAEG